MARKVLQFPSAWICISFWIILAENSRFCESVTIDIQSTGESSGQYKVTLTCLFPSRGNAVVKKVEWRRQTGSGWDNLVTHTPPGQPSFVNAGLALENRVVLSGNGNRLVLQFQEVECGDEGTYNCTVTYPTTSLSATRRLRLQVRPMQPFSLTLAPDKEMFIIGEQVTFTCSANVDQPRGQFHWRVIFENGDEDDITRGAKRQAVVTTETDSVCSSVEKSSVTLTMDRTFPGAVVRCKVINRELTKKKTTTVDSECSRNCLQTDKLKVQNKAKSKISAAVSIGKKYEEFDSQAIVIVISVFSGILLTMASASVCVYCQKKKTSSAAVDRLAESDTSVKYGKFEETKPVDETVTEPVTESVKEIDVQEKDSAGKIEKNEERLLTMPFQEIDVQEKDSAGKTEDNEERPPTIPFQEIDDQEKDSAGKIEKKEERLLTFPFHDAEEDIGRVWQGTI
ncbi:uncharacterized protein LOC121386460 [Gigantopelta aegis]|uniref:uncharacterized protein LOC121386460 n=1 Tax=Gigantopelta aegis TaxID=1735272 RepID=UPI001B889DC2|nr:uncharacterized protein LOC121386460 [Gigantopelta aegis]